MKIGILTGGGDCPGLNAVIRAVVKQSTKNGDEVTGFKSGWSGLYKGETIPLPDQSISGILPKGGTIIGTSRFNPFKNEDHVARCIENIKKCAIDALIAVGGEDTLGAAEKFYQKGVHIVGVPKTIDNDLGCTDYTFGFDTAVTVATEAVDRLHSTAESHDRIIVVEVMGRHTGWIATVAGLAGGADCILIPEKPFDIEKVVELIERRHKRGRNFSIIVAAEGAKPKDGTFTTQEKEKDAFGHVRLGGISHVIAEEIKNRTGYDTRVTILGHIQRGGSPTSFDRVLATRFGISAVKLIKEKKFGNMVALQGNKIVPVKLKDAVSSLKTVDMELFEIAEVFFG